MEPLDVERIRPWLLACRTRGARLRAAPLLKALGAGEAVRASFMFYKTRDEAAALAAALEQPLRGGG
ncbi:MAG: hypothetical protein ACJ754_16735 [Pyrinomonadaceae bacterium]